MSEIYIDFSKPDYLHDEFEEMYSKSCANCRETYEMHIEAIDCTISLAKKRIKELRIEQEDMRAAVYQGAKIRRNCVDPTINEDEIERINEYIEFLKGKKSQLLKNTRSLFAKEKYEYLKLLGLFSTEQWGAIVKNSLIEDRQKLIAELIGCDPDTARDFINGHNKVNSTQEKQINDRINRLKGV